jgi:hypothetical protein
MNPFHEIFLKHPYVSLLLNPKSYLIEHVNKKFEKVVMSRNLAVNLNFADDFLQSSDKKKFIDIVEEFKNSEKQEIEVTFKTLTTIDQSNV